MKAFLLYTAARVGLFVITWVVVMTVAAFWLDWSMVTALWTALIALAISAVLSLWLLRSLRERLAERVHHSAVRARRSFQSARAREDEDG